MSVFSQLLDSTLSAKDSKLLLQVANDAAALLPDRPEQVADLLPLIPESLRETLTDLAGDVPDLCHVIVRGIEVGEVPPTPQRSRPNWMHPSGGVLALVAELLGELSGYAEEKQGALIHDVVPVRGEEMKIENTGAVQFDFHTENVHHPLRPDYLGLLCLRQDHDGVAATRVASARDAVERLEPAQVALLRRPVYRSKFPSSFTRNAFGDRLGAPPFSGLHPVLWGPDDAPFIRFNAHNTKAPDTDGAVALGALGRALDIVSNDVVLEPGELLVLDNHRAVHGRVAFTPRFDGRDRWLRRAYALHSVPDWAKKISDRPRVLPPMAEIMSHFDGYAPQGASLAGFGETEE